MVNSTTRGRGCWGTSSFWWCWIIFISTWKVKQMKTRKEANNLRVKYISLLFQIYYYLVSIHRFIDLKTRKNSSKINWNLLISMLNLRYNLITYKGMTWQLNLHLSVFPYPLVLDPNHLKFDPQILKVNFHHWDCASAFWFLYHWLIDTIVSYAERILSQTCLHQGKANNSKRIALGV